MGDRALDDLIAAVEAGQVSTDLIMQAFGNGWDDILVLAAYDGSLDAAKDLHEALLPGWRVRTSQPDHYLPEAPFTVNVWPVDASRIEAVFQPGGTNDDMARAWLLAILRAYRGMQG